MQAQFKSREAFVAFRRQWRKDYAELTEVSREFKKMARGRTNDRSTVSLAQSDVAGVKRVARMMMIAREAVDAANKAHLSSARDLADRLTPDVLTAPLRKEVEAAWGASVVARAQAIYERRQEAAKAKAETTPA